MAYRRIRDTTVIITGATSGIGRETAREFARRGARVVAAGRRENRLAELVDEVERRDGEILAVPTDVAEPDSVRQLVRRAGERFGGVDTLVNNAGAGFVAPFAEQSLDEFRRLMDVNFWGAVIASREVLPVMRAQTAGGLIINVSSILGKRGVPFQTAYCASKFALAGFSSALRTELASERIDVSTIFPGAVESEIWQSATNRTGLEMPGFVPKFPARELARVIVQNARLPQPEVVMALDAMAIDFFNRLAPGVMDLLLGWSVPLAKAMDRDQGEG